MNNFHDPDHWRFQHEYAEGHTNDSPVDLSGREGAPKMPINEEDELYTDYRSRSLEDALTNSAAYNDCGGEPEALLDALLADARHFADRHNLDFARADRSAYGIYLRDRTELNR